VPVSILLACIYGGFWAHLTSLIALVIAPMLDWILPLDEDNPTKEEEKVMEGMIRFSIITWLWPVVETLTLLFATYTVVYNSHALSTSDLIGIITSCGYVVAAAAPHSILRLHRASSYTLFILHSFMAGLGVNNAHELLHKRNMYEKMLGQYCLLLASYQHYYIEHAVGHHIHVATHDDPSTARLNESIFSFWARAVPEAYKKAWKLENERLEKNGIPFWSVQNQMLVFSFNTLLIYLVFLAFFGVKGALFFAAQGTLGFLLVEVRR
jgi:alkane 1-monooxygenase